MTVEGLAGGPSGWQLGPETMCYPYIAVPQTDTQIAQHDSPGMGHSVATSWTGPALDQAQLSFARCTHVEFQIPAGC